MVFLLTIRKLLKPHYDDDDCDRLHRFHTPLLFLAFALLLSTKQYVGQPIQCWTPATFTESWEEYAESYCFAQNSYFLGTDEGVPATIEGREEREIGYYQWVPFMLGIQAILFCLPALVWRLFNWQTGIGVKAIVTMARKANGLKQGAYNYMMRETARHIYDALAMQRKMATNCWLHRLIVGRGSYLTNLYLLAKVFSVTIVCAQFVILNNFLSTSYTLWGFGILGDLWNGREWQESGHFPRVTMCDFEVRVLGNIHRHTVECVLVINMFNEKVYLFLWFWLVFVLLYTVANAVQWFVDICSEERRRRFITCYLRVLGVVVDDHMLSQNSMMLAFLRDCDAERALSAFLDFLGKDGVTILRLIETNSGPKVTTDLVGHLWNLFTRSWIAKEKAASTAIANNEHAADDGDDNDASDLDSDAKKCATI